jgi:hypothetical protein
MVLTIINVILKISGIVLMVIGAGAVILAIINYIMGLYEKKWDIDWEEDDGLPEKMKNCITVSQCCSAKLTVSTADEGTSCYICSKCGKQMDLQYKKKYE